MSELTDLLYRVASLTLDAAVNAQDDQKGQLSEDAVRVSRLALAFTEPEALADALTGAIKGEQLTAFGVELLCNLRAALEDVSA